MSTSRHCTHCPHFISEVKSKRYPGYIGKCGLYDRLVKDTLCGCRTDSENVILLNFEKEDAE